ncbi:MAG: hypothetical protein LIO37_04925 [Clostridiales bacterium]|nr:hypothetical protein [Clostridiales bacterium]
MTDRQKAVKNFHDLHGRQRIQYIWDYYKLPLLVACIILYIIGYIIYGKVTHKDVALYIASVNITMSDSLSAELTDGFLSVSGIDSSRNSVSLYSNLYLTDDTDDEMFQYSYASSMKILGSIDGELLDVVIMNQEAFDAFSQNGYLCDLETLLTDADPELYELLESALTTNIIIQDGNSSEMNLDESVSYTAEIEEGLYGLDLSESSLIQEAGFDGTLYLGVIENSPRKETAIAYLHFLYS